MKFDIYQLNDPDTGNTRYVGYSKDAYERFTVHLRDAVDGRNTYKAHWILSLLKQHKHPVLKVVAQVQGRAEACRVETALIASLRARGCALVNGTIGGDGGDTITRHPELDRLRKEAGDRLKERWLDSDYRQKMIELSQNQVGPNRGRVIGASEKARIGTSVRERYKDPTLRASCGRPGRIVSEETRQKLQTANKGKPGRRWSDSERQALSLKMAGEQNPFYGKKHTDETRKRMQEAR